MTTWDFLTTELATLEHEGLRVMLSAAHTREDVAFALEAFGRIGQACQIIPAV